LFDTLGKKEQFQPLLAFENNAPAEEAPLDLPLEEIAEPPPPSSIAKKLFWLKMSIVMGTLFIAESSRGLVVPSLFLYIASMGGDARMVGIAVGGFSVGRLVGGVLFGWWFNRFGGKWALACCLFVSILGNILYALGPVTHIYALIASRIITGFSTGILSVVRAVVAEMTTTEQRTKFMALSSAVQFLGFAIVPGLGAALAQIDFSVGKVPVDQFTSPGYLLVIVNTVMLAIVVVFYPLPKSQVECQLKEIVAQIPKDVQVTPFENNRRLLIVGATTFIAFNLIGRGVLALLETVGAPVFLDAWGEQVDDVDPVQDTASMMLGLGLAGLVVYFLIDPLRRVLTEESLLAGSFCLIGGGSLFLIRWGGSVGLWRFIIGAGMIWSLGSPISQTLVISAFSKMLGGKPQGTMMGWIGSAGSIGRIVFPFLSGFLGNDLSFIISAVVCFLSAAAVVVYSWWVKKNRSVY